MSLSRHARKRLQQRGITEGSVEVLIDFGFAQHVAGGAEVIYLRHQDQGMVRGILGQAALPNHYQNSYLMLGQDGCVITAGHRYRKVQQH